MKKLIGYGVFTLFVAQLVLLPLALVVNSDLAVVSLAVLLLSGYYVFKDTLNLIQAVGPVYWITRDGVPRNTPLLSSGFMRETQAPWRVGKGIQVAFKGRSFQLGICHKQHYQNNLDGELAVVQGRFMDTPPEEIGMW